MNLSSLLEAIAPGFAARRIMNQGRLLAVKRYYEALDIAPHRRRRGESASGDRVVDRARGGLRQYARWLDENDPTAISVLDDLVTFTVGRGVSFEPMATRRDGTPLDDLNAQLAEMWEAFWERPDVTGELPGTELERITARTLYRDGEVLSRSHQRTARRGVIPLSLELLEPDYLPFESDESRRIVHGVQFDEWGAPVNYHLLKRHPGALNSWSSWSEATVSVPAAEIIHEKIVKRLSQVRGVSRLHGVLTTLDDLKDYKDSERVAARVAAALTGYIRSDGDFASPLDRKTPSDNPDQDQLEMAPGMILRLGPGEDGGIFDTKRPGDSFEPYIKTLKREVAGGTGARASSVMKDYNGTYSAQRQELVEGWEHYAVLFDYRCQKFYRPIWRLAVDAAIFSGMVRVPNNCHAPSLYRPAIRGPSMVWINPQDELTAHETAVRNGFRARHQVIRILGEKPREVDAMLEKDQFDVRPTNANT